MITAEVDHCKTLEEFYKSIRSQQEEYHGDNYCDQHDVITRLLEKCNTYKELGTHQGATAACALMSKPSKVQLVDINLEKYNKSKHLFESYCDEHNIDLIVKESSSHALESLSRTEVLLIDSVHRPRYLDHELRLHESWVSDYIVFHDTTIPDAPGLYPVIETFCKEINQWEIVERGTANVGYTVIQRMK